MEVRREVKRDPAGWVRAMGVWRPDDGATGTGRSHDGASFCILYFLARGPNPFPYPEQDMTMMGRLLQRISGSSRGLSPVLAVFGLLVLVSAAGAQIPDEVTSESIPSGVGWPGFMDLSFLLGAFLNLALAAVLGAVIGYHPRRIRTADTLEEIEAPKVSIVYSVIGSLIGILVVRFGLVVGFVLFGIGGLIRFRTVMRSAQLTGQVIFVTLIGLTCGLDLPHVAVLAALFDFILTYLLESRITYRVDVRGLPLDRFSEAAEAYRSVLARPHYRVLSETKRPDKGHVAFIFRSTGRDTRQHIEGLLEEHVEESLRGSLDWEVD